MEARGVPRGSPQSATQKNAIDEIMRWTAIMKGFRAERVRTARRERGIKNREKRRTREERREKIKCAKADVFGRWTRFFKCFAR